MEKRQLDPKGRHHLGKRTRQPRYGRRRRHRRAGPQQYKKAPAHQPLGYLVRPLRRGIPRTGHAQPHVPRPRIRARQHQYRRQLPHAPRPLHFLEKQQSSSPNYIYTGDDKYKFIEAIDPKWQGALPYSLLVEPGGKIVYAHQGAIDPEQLRKIIFDDPYMGRIYK